MNDVYFEGNLTREPFTAGSAKFFTLAKDLNKKVDGGWEKINTTFADCKAFGKAAEIMDSVQKGSKILVAGRLESYSKEEDGKKVSKMSINVSAIYKRLKPENSDFPSPETDGDLPF